MSDFKDCTSHYHVIHEKELPHGKIKVDITLIAPSGEIPDAFRVMEKILQEDVLSYTPTGGAKRE